VRARGFGRWLANGGLKSAFISLVSPGTWRSGYRRRTSAVQLMVIYPHRDRDRRPRHTPVQPARRALRAFRRRASPPRAYSAGCASARRAAPASNALSRRQAPAAGTRRTETATAGLRLSRAHPARQSMRRLPPRAVARLARGRAEGLGSRIIGRGGRASHTSPLARDLAPGVFLRVLAQWHASPRRRQTRAQPEKGPRPVRAGPKPRRTVAPPARRSAPTPFASPSRDGPAGAPLAREPRHRATRPGFACESATAESRLPRLPPRARAPARRASPTSNARSIPRSAAPGRAEPNRVCRPRRSAAQPARRRFRRAARAIGPWVRCRLVTRDIACRPPRSRALARRAAPT